MCCFEHPYVGIFESEVIRRVTYVGTAAIEILDRICMCGLSSLEFSTTVRNSLRNHLWLIGVFIIFIVLFGLLHCAMFRGPAALPAQIIIKCFISSCTIGLLLTLVSIPDFESWPQGVLSICFLVMAAIKFIGIFFTCIDAVDMTSDWGYLVEFVFGVFIVAAGVSISILIFNGAFFISVVVGGSLSVVFSMVSLLDLHQNMSINSWWWEDGILNGCVYQVVRQLVLTCCVRVEDPTSIVVTEDEPSEEASGRAVEIVETTRR